MKGGKGKRGITLLRLNFKPLARICREVAGGRRAFVCGNLESLSKAEAIGSGLEEDAGNTFQLALTVAPFVVSHQHSTW